MEKSTRYHLKKVFNVINIDENGVIIVNYNTYFSQCAEVKIFASKMDAVGAYAVGRNLMELDANMINYFVCQSE